MLVFLWPSTEVYVINLLIGAAIFFSFRRLSGKFIFDEKKRKWAVWSATIVLTPLIYAGLVVAMVFSWNSIPQKDFNRKDWFSDKNSRHEMTENIVGSRMLEGKNENEVIQLIGKPDRQDTTRAIWTYDLGMGAEDWGFFSTP